MTVSALIPTFNRLDYVQKAIDSVLEQTKPVDEIVVIDDGSTDRTAQVLHSNYGSRIRLIQQENAGVSGARRRGLEEATTDWVAFLDSDDQWTAHRNELFCSIVPFIDQDVAWIFGDLRIVSDGIRHETIFQRHGLRLEQPLTVFQDSLQVQFPYQFCLLQGSMIRRNALLEAGCFSDDLRHSEDVLAGFQIAVRYKFAAVREIVTELYRTSDLQASSTELEGMNGPDYYRARMSAFRLIADSGTVLPWGQYYADAVRGLCKWKAAHGESFWKSSLEQFRFCFSPLSLAFLAIALFGRPGLWLWYAAGRFSRAVGLRR